MTQTAQDVELDEAIAVAELDDDEAAQVRELVEGGGIIAAAIEHVLGQREPAETPDDDDAPPAAPPAAAFVVDTKKVEKEIERHLEKMADLLGPEAEAYEPCDECGGAGIVIPGPKMKAHEMYRACPTCEGYGRVLTGAKDPQFATQPCPDCAGRGFQTKSATPSPEAPAGALVAERGDGYGTETWMGDPSLQPKPAGAEWH